MIGDSATSCSRKWSEVPSRKAISAKANECIYCIANAPYLLCCRNQGLISDRNDQTMELLRQIWVRGKKCNRCVEFLGSENVLFLIPLIKYLSTEELMYVILTSQSSVQPLSNLLNKQWNISKFDLSLIRIEIMDSDEVIQLVACGTSWRWRAEKGNKITCVKKIPQFS